MRGAFHRLKVLETRPESDQAVSVVFDVPGDLKEKFAWTAGQHVTLRLVIEGQEHRRSYSISQTPVTGEPLRITVKRVDGGTVSNHVNDTVCAGDAIDVMAPFGGFRLLPDRKARRTYYFFAAGSGITPLFAMIRSVLEAEPHSTAYLVYGNSNADEIIFDKRLAELELHGNGRLEVLHVLSSPSWFSSFDYWRRGRIDADAVQAVIEQHPPYAQDTQYYVCGPGSMNAAVRSALMNLDVPMSRIHMESYGGEVEQDTSFEGVAAEAQVTLNGSRLTVPVAAGQTILDALRSAGAEPPYSCQSGVCGACSARLHSGEAHLRARMGLSDEEIAAGRILTCQAVAKTPRLAVDYG